MGKNSFISSFKKIPSAALIAVLLVAFTLVSGGYYLAAVNALPAPMFTGRVSLDEKIRFLRGHRPVDVEIAVLGSSAALNNVSSGILTERIPGSQDTYFNFAAWGLELENMNVYWDFIDKYYDPKMVILCFTPELFAIGSQLRLDEEDVEGYINGKFPLSYYVKYRHMGFLDRTRRMKKMRESNAHYASLKFDQNGGVFLDFTRDESDVKDWEKKVRVDFLGKPYEELDRLLRTFKEQDILAVYVVSPMREFHLDIGRDSGLVEEHWNKVQSIVNKHGMVFINMHKVLRLDDQYFLDPSHMNGQGAKVFTRRLVEEMKKRDLLGALRDGGISGVSNH